MLVSLRLSALHLLRVLSFPLSLSLALSLSLPSQEVSGDTEAWEVVQEYIKSKGGAI